jgi:IclR family transcriptional regulator, pca regulon regulatory protein
MHPSQDPEDAPQPGDAYVQSFARGLAVIRSFSAERARQTLTEVAQATGLTRAGARRILLTLQTLGYVRADQRHFELTPRILELGYAYLSAQPLWDVAEPVMQALTARTGESTSAAVLDGTDVVYVARVPAQKLLRLSLGVGSRLPAYCTSLGRVLWADVAPDLWLPGLRAQTLKAFTPRTLLNADDIAQRVVQARKQGHCIVVEEIEEGLISMAVPIADRDGRTVAALNISSQTSRYGPRALQKELLPALQAAAAQISQLIHQRGH